MMTDDLRSLDAFFTPDTVAIIGASREDGKIGHTILENFVHGSYDGAIVPVNPEADEIEGLQCYPSVGAYDGQVDHAVIAVPPAVANDVLQDCVDAGVPAVTIVTAGYEEIGAAGEKRQEELEEIVAGTDTRIIGPNCLGIWDAYSGVDTLFLPDAKLDRPPQGSIALISQSGSFGSAILDMGAEMEIGFSRFISYGNQADVNETDLVQWLAADDETEAIAVYMEGAHDGREMYDRLREVTTDIPVVIYKAGKSGGGAEAASSHTGSLAGSYSVYKGAFRQSGVVEAKNVEQLFDLSRALAYEDTAEGEDVAIITNGGGFGVSAADYIEAYDLSLAEFTDETREALEDVLPEYATAHNPLDVIGDADAERYRKALEIAARDPNVDAVLSLVLLQPATMSDAIIDHLQSFKEEYDKPLVSCMVGGAYTGERLRELEHHHVPTFSTPERAVAAMHALREYGLWEDRPD